jgi:hypothetical protein
MAEDHLSREASEALAKRRRGRNIAMLIALLALSALFYLIAVVKMRTGALAP